MMQLTYKKLGGSKARPMRRGIGPLYAIMFLCYAIMGTSCSEPSDNPLFGLWEADVPGGPDFGYKATWRINHDGSYRLDFASVSIAGGAEGYSIGTYDLVSDSILVVHSTEHENLGYNYAFSKDQDTLYVEVEDSMLTSTAVRLVGKQQYKNAGTTIKWERH